MTKSILIFLKHCRFALCLIIGYLLFCFFSASVNLPAEKFCDTDDEPNEIMIDKKQVILNSGDELYAEIR